MNERETIVAEIAGLVEKARSAKDFSADYYFLGRYVAANWDLISNVVARADDGALLQMTLAHNVRKAALEEAAQAADRFVAIDEAAGPVFRAGTIGKAIAIVIRALAGEGPGPSTLAAEISARPSQASSPDLRGEPAPISAQDPEQLLDSLILHGRSHGGSVERDLSAAIKKLKAKARKPAPALSRDDWLEGRTETEMLDEQNMPEGWAAEIRHALSFIKTLCVGDASEHGWAGDLRTTRNRMRIADICDDALRAAAPEPPR